MIAECYICGEDFEVDDSELLKEDELDEMVCPDCCELAMAYWHNLRLS